MAAIGLGQSILVSSPSPHREGPQKRKADEPIESRTSQAASRSLFRTLGSLGNFSLSSSQRTFELPTPPLSSASGFLPLPDFSLFSRPTVHTQLRAARDRQGSTRAGKQHPCTPFRPTIKKGQEHPFYERLQKEERMIEEGQAPIAFDFGDRQRREITHVGSLIGQGDFSKVYICQVEGIGPCVVKLFYGRGADRALQHVAHQLLVYARNRSNDSLTRFTPIFYNFEPHWEAVSKMNIQQVIAYVRDNALSSVRLMPFIEHEFPLDNWAPDHSAWLQLKALFAADRASRHSPNDISRDNVRITGERVQLIDLPEVEQEALEGDRNKRASSFTDVEAQIGWLLS